MDCEKNPFLQMSQDQIQKLDAVLSSEQAKALLQATSSDKLFSDPKLDDVLSHDVPIIGPMEEGKLPSAIEETLNLGVSLKDLEHLVLDQAASGSGIFSENSEVADMLDETQNIINAIWLDHCYALPPVTVASVSTEVTSSDLALASIEPTRTSDAAVKNLPDAKAIRPLVESAEKLLTSTTPNSSQNLVSQSSSPVPAPKLSSDGDEIKSVGSTKLITSSPSTSAVLSESENSDSSKRNDKDSKIEPVRRSQRQLDKIEREQVEKIRAENVAIQRRELEEMEKLKTRKESTEDQQTEPPNISEQPRLGDGIIESDDEKSLASLRKDGTKESRDSPKVSPSKPDRKLSVSSPIKSIHSEDEKDNEKKLRRASADRKGRARTDSETSTDDAKLKTGRSKSVDHSSPLKISRKSPKSRISLEEKLAEELKKKAEENAKKEAEELAKKEKALELKRKKLKKEKSQPKIEDFEPALFSLPDKIIKDKSECKNNKLEHLEEVKSMKFESELKLENLDCPEAKREIKEFKEKSEANSNVSLTHEFGSDAEPYNELALIANHLMESDSIPTSNISLPEPPEQNPVLGSPTGLASPVHKSPRVKAINDEVENKLTLNKAGKGTSTKTFVSSSNEVKSVHSKGDTTNQGLVKQEGKMGPIKEITRPQQLVILSKEGRKVLSKDGKMLPSKDGINRNLTKEQKMAMKSKLSNNMENASKTKKKGYIVKHLLMKSKKQEQFKQARVEGRPILKKKSSNLKTKGGNFPSRRPVSQRHKRKKGMPGDDLEYSDDSDDSDWDSEDDPEKLWCICRKPSNDRFMIQCDYCSDWFHGSCVNVTKQLGKQMEKEQKEWKCPRCIKGMPPVSAQPVILDNNAVEKAKPVKKANPLVEVKEIASLPKTIAISSQIVKCIMCKKPSPKESIYCSALCIEKHGSEVLKGMPKEATKSIGKIEQKPPHRLLVIEKKSGKLLMGSNAPTSENLVAWLKANPTYEVVKPGPVTPSRRTSETVSPVKKVLKAESAPVEEKQPESVRQNVRKTLKEILVLRCKEADDVDTSEDEIKRIALNIEEHLFRLFKDTGSKYKSKYRSLMFNVKDPRNQGLFRKIVKGKIPPDQLVKKTPEELASKELAMWREREAQHALEMIKKEQLEQLQNPTHLIKKTHKGEVEVQDDQLLIVEKDEKTEASVEATEKALDMGQMLADTTNEHRSHLFDLNCKICTGKKTPAESKGEKPNNVKVATTISIERSEFTDTEKDIKSGEKMDYPATPKVSKPKKTGSVKKSSKRSNSIQEEASDHEPTSTVSFGSPDGDIKAKKNKKDSSSKGPPSVWKGFIYMIDVAKFVTSALRVSGPTDNLNTDIPDSVQVCGRISPEEVWSYLGKIKQSGNKELIIIKFQPANDEEKSTYESFFIYLNSRKRYGVVKSSCKTIKDFYIVPLSSHTPVPTVLMPFNGPGLETNRPDLLLGVLVRHKSRTKALTNRSKSKSSDKVEAYEPSYTPPLDAMPCQSTKVDSSNSVPSLYQPTTLKPEKVAKKKIKVSVDDEPYEPSYTPPLEKIPKLTSDEDKPYDPEENAELEISKPGLDIRSLLPILSTKSSLPPASATSLLTSVASAAITANTDLETQKKLLAELTREVEHQKEQIEQKNRSLVGNVSRILSSATDSPKVGSLTPPNPPPIKVPVSESVKQSSVVLDRSGNLSANLQDIQIPDMLQSILNNIRGKPSVKPSIQETNKHFEAKPDPTRIRGESESSPFSSILSSSGNIIPFLSDDTPKILNPPMMTSNKVFSNISDIGLKGESSIPSFLVPQNKPLITTPITVKAPLRKDDISPPAKVMIREVPVPPKNLLELHVAQRNKSKEKLENKTNEPLPVTATSETSTPKAGIHFTIKRLKPQSLPCNNSPIVEPEPLKKSKIGELLPVKPAIPERSLTPPLPPPPPPPPKQENNVSNLAMTKNEPSSLSSSPCVEIPGASTWSPVPVPDTKFKTISERICQAALSQVSKDKSIKISQVSAPVSLPSKLSQSTPLLHAIPVPPSIASNSPQTNKSSLNLVNSPCSISTTPPHNKSVSMSLKPAEPAIENSQILGPPSKSSSALRVQSTPLPTVQNLASSQPLATNTWPTSTFTEPPPPGVETEDIQAKERLLPSQSSLANQQYQSISYPSQSGYSVQSTFYNQQTSQHPYYMAQNPQWNRAPGAIGNIRPPLPSSWAQNQHYQQPNQPYQHYQQHPQIPHHSQPHPQPYHQHSQSYTQPQSQPHNQQQHSQPHNQQHPQPHDQQSQQHLLHTQQHNNNNNQSTGTDQLHPGNNQNGQQPNLQPPPPQVTPQNPQQYRPRIPPPTGNQRMPWRSPRPRWNEPNPRWNNDRGGFDDYNRRDWDRDSRSHSRGRKRSRDKSVDREKSRENTPDDTNKSAGKNETRKRERSKDRGSSRNSSDRSQDRSRSRSRSKSRSRSPDRSRSRARSRARSVKSRDGSRDRSKSVDKSRDRSKSVDKRRDRSKSVEKSRDRSHSYDRSRSRSRSHSRDRSRERSRSRDHSRDRSRSRGYSRDRSRESGRRDNWKNFRRFNGGRDRYRRRPNFWDKRKT